MKKLIAFIALVLLCACGQKPAPSQEVPAAPAPAQAPSPPVATVPDENAAIAVLKEIQQAQTDFFGRNRRYALEYTELIDTHFLREEPAVSRTGYEIRMRPSADAASYTVSAVPAASSDSARHLFMDQSGVIHAEQGKDATAQSPKI